MKLTNKTINIGCQPTGPQQQSSTRKAKKIIPQIINEINANEAQINKLSQWTKTAIAGEIWIAKYSLSMNPKDLTKSPLLKLPLILFEHTNINQI